MSCFQSCSYDSAVAIAPGLVERDAECAVAALDHTRELIRGVDSTSVFGSREKPRAIGGRFRIIRRIPPINNALARRSVRIYTYRLWHVGIFTRRVDLSRRAHRAFPSFFLWQKLKYISPQTRPILLSNFSSSPSFSDTIDPRIVLDPFANTRSKLFYRLLDFFKSSDVKVLKNFQGFSYVRRFLLFRFMCDRRPSRHVPRSSYIL